MNNTVFPFSAVVGQEPMKLALLLAAVNPRIGGVLIRGERGTAKSTAARGLAALLPSITVIDGCACGCDPDDEGGWCSECVDRRSRGQMASIQLPAPFVDLPVSATEDRVVGSFDLEAALRRGTRQFQPGLLASAHRGILYVDEVNLLDDHVVDLLLDVAASGVNIVEREGLTHRHPARFVLVGTMNPEEGDLRPQLLDRFGLCVDVLAAAGNDERVAILERSSYTVAGKSAVSDPQTDRLSSMVEKLVSAQAIGSGKSEGISLAWVVLLGLVSLVGGLLGIAGVLYAVLKP